MNTKTGAVVRTLITLLLIGSVVFALGAAFSLFDAAINGEVMTPVAVYPTQVASSAVLSTMGVASDSAVVAQVTQMDEISAVIVALPSAAVSGVVAAIMLLLSALLRDVDKGRPFSASNVARLRTVARLTLLAAVLGWWLEPAAQAWVQARLDSAVVGVDASLTPVVVALGVYALVQIWERGTDLADFEEHAV